jgi:hypothetical protein
VQGVLLPQGHGGTVKKDRTRLKRKVTAMNIVINLVKGTLLSMLVFFTVSFFSVIYSIQHPEYHGEMHLGFPYRYYYQFWLRGSDYPNCSGNFVNLLWDCTICWIIVTGLFLFAKRIQRKRPIN